MYLTERPIPSRNPQGLYKPPPPQPSFRLRSAVLRATESSFIISALEESFRERPITAPGSSGSDTGSMDIDYQMSHIPRRRGGDRSTNDDDGIHYKLYFPAPMGSDKFGTLRYHLTTRNFFAILYNKSLVGMTLGQTLLDLVDRTDLYLSPPSPLTYDLVVDRGMSEIESPYGSLLSSSRALGPKVGHAHTQLLIMDYLRGRDFDDVRNWPEGAAGLVVWAERAGASGGLGYGLGGGEMGMGGVESLWREGFVHCTGMLARLEGGGEWRDISPITKALVDRASLEIQVRVAQADSRLSGFNFNDMWPAMSSASPPAKVAFDKFQKFLVKHYQSRFGSWPPNTPDGRFSRMLYVQLQRDFSALYDYLVDREVSWTAQTHHPRQTPPDKSSPPKMKLVNPKIPHWRADDDDLHITDMLVAFDERHNFPHIPHPFPLVPPSMALGQKVKSPTAAGRFFQGARRGSVSGSPSLASGTADKAAALSLSESTNIESLLSSSISNDLVDAFAKHEKSVSVAEVDPHAARKGRWILVYGILQTLATVAVDAPGIRHTEGVDYFLCAKLRGTPPWKGGGERGMDTSGVAGSSGSDERSHFRSHCWTVPRTWRSAEPLPTLAYTPEGCVTPDVIELPIERTEDADDDAESGDDGDDEMGDVWSVSEGFARTPSRGHGSAGGMGSPVMVENKVRWQDAWGMGSPPPGTAGRTGGGSYYQ